LVGRRPPGPAYGPVVYFAPQHDPAVRLGQKNQGLARGLTRGLSRGLTQGLSRGLSEVLTEVSDRALDIRIADFKGCVLLPLLLCCLKKIVRAMLHWRSAHCTSLLRGPLQRPALMRCRRLGLEKTVGARTGLNQPFPSPRTCYVCASL
jgi:hypothetical protein